MTVVEHAICSALLAQFGVWQRHGRAGLAAVVFAGIAPDLDSAVKLYRDDQFWRLHHALGHSLVSVALIAAVTTAAVCAVAKNRSWQPLLLWCFVSACVHVVTDALYWWPVKPLWPLGDTEVCFGILEYLDLLVLAMWLVGGYCLYRFSASARLVAGCTLCVFASYVVLRAALPAPTGVLKLLTGGWMYAAPNGTPVLDWW